MKIIFMGTPLFALPTLKALVGAGHEILAVYTQPPRPAGRGQKETPSPIHQYALEKVLAVRTPVSLKSPEEQQAFANLKADAAVVAAYGLLLPKAILEGTKHGCINIHPSLLPRWRGAAPIQRAVIAGDTETAMCIMQMDEGLDTGDVLLSQITPIGPEETAGELHDRLAVLGGDMLVQTLKLIESGKTNRTPQSGEPVYAKKIDKTEARIQWNKPACDINNLIRGLSPSPGAYTTVNGEQVKILKAEFGDMPHDRPGRILDDRLTIACSASYLRPLIIQRPGKKPMSIADALRGWLIPADSILE